MTIVIVLMFLCLMVLLLTGYPVAWVLGAVAVFFGAAFLGMDFMQLLPLRIFGIMTNFTLLAVPLFIFMGIILDKSGLAGDLLEAAATLFGSTSGGMAIAVVLVGSMLAATTGVVGATVVAMGIIALPVMLRHGYSPVLASGVIAASGTLGQIIPPSIILILLGDVIGVPVGRLFVGAILPSLLIIALFLLYVTLLSWRVPHLAPPIPRTEKQTRPGRLLVILLPPLLLIFAVLGSIFLGIASPTESAAVGALGSMLLAVLHRRLRLANLQSAMQQTVRMTAMIFMILVGATAFGLVFRGLGGEELIFNLMGDLPGGKWSFIAISMLLIFFLGFFLDFLQICFIVIPILTPVATALQIDKLWFAILIGMNLQTSFLTPPFGFSLFYLKAVAPAGFRIQSIYRGVIPFIGLQMIAIILLFMFPKLVTWLPDTMDRIQGLA